MNTVYAFFAVCVFCCKVWKQVHQTHQTLLPTQFIQVVVFANKLHTDHNVIATKLCSISGTWGQVSSIYRTWGQVSSISGTWGQGSSISGTWGQGSSISGTRGQGSSISGTRGQGSSISGTWGQVSSIPGTWFVLEWRAIRKILKATFWPFCLLFRFRWQSPLRVGGADSTGQRWREHSRQTADTISRARSSECKRKERRNSQPWTPNFITKYQNAKWDIGPVIESNAESNSPNSCCSVGIQGQHHSQSDTRWLLLWRNSAEWQRILWCHLSLQWNSKCLSLLLLFAKFRNFIQPDFFAFFASIVDFENKN